MLMKWSNREARPELVAATSDFIKKTRITTTKYSSFGILLALRRLQNVFSLYDDENLAFQKKLQNVFYVVSFVFIQS